jgi:hypothetical protein
VTQRWIPAEPDEAAYPEPPGGGIVVALLGGLATAGSVFLVFAPPLVLVWLAIAAILTGAIVRRGIHVLTATVAAITPAIVTFVSAQCLTGMWGWLIAGLVLMATLLLVGTPIGFGIGRLLRSRIARAYVMIRGVLAVTAVLSLAGWVVVIANALVPGECPPPP